ncbi:MAG: hypothetical protein Q9209_001253 [Squamulea sp. 1 TL-2023]
MASASDLDDSTVPNTPDSNSGDAVQLAQHEVFAWLRPLNKAACQGFDATVNTVIKYSSQFDHIRQFLHCDNRQERAPSVFTEDSGGSDHEPAAPTKEWAGAFGLRIIYLPSDPVLGWRLGTNRGRSASPEVDLLLAPPTDHWVKTRISGHHVTLSLDPGCSRIVLHARHTVTISWRGAKTLRRSESHVLENGEVIHIGNCAYTFEYTDYFFSLNFESTVSHYMRKYHNPLWAINKYISPNSVGSPTLIGKYYCSPSAFAQGTFGKVAAGWTANGATVAVKTFKTPDKREIRSHFKMMGYIGKHDNIAHLLDFDDHLNAAVPDAYCVYTPLAVANLKEIINAYTPDVPAKTALFTDFLAGLSHLHQKGVMHRDISPGNLAITSLQQPIGIIIDLDAATSDTYSSDHMKGTMTFLAPEIMDLKDWDKHRNGKQPPPLFDKSVDIWALGLNIRALYAGQPFHWISAQAVTESVHNIFQTKLLEEIHRTKDPDVRIALNLVMQMTEYKAANRVTASDAHMTILPVYSKHQTRGTIVPRRGAKRRWENQP